MVRLSAAATNPAPFIKALYPPPEAAIPMFGRIEALFRYWLMYVLASNPVMFTRVNHSIMGSTVTFRLTCSHAVSFGDNEFASLIVGLVSGQVTTAGAYPPDGEFGKARFASYNVAASVSSAKALGDASRGSTIEPAAKISVVCYIDC